VGVLDVHTWRDATGTTFKRVRGGEFGSTCLLLNVLIRTCRYSGQHIEIPCSHLAQLAYASASDAVGDPAFYGNANSLLWLQGKIESARTVRDFNPACASPARERAESQNLDDSEEATNDGVLQFVAAQNIAPGSPQTDFAPNASLILGTESDFIAQMCEDPCRRVDLGLAMVRAMELDRTDAQVSDL